MLSPAGAVALPRPRVPAIPGGCLAGKHVAPAGRARCWMLQQVLRCRQSPGTVGAREISQALLDSGWVLFLFFLKERKRDETPPARAAGQTPGSAAAAQRSFPAKRLSRHKATRGWCSPSPPREWLGCTSLPTQLNLSRDRAARAWQGNKEPQTGSCGEKPR